MSDEYLVIPPAANVWDVDAIVKAAHEVLRLAEGDVDDARLSDLATTAVGRVDAYVDLVQPITATAAMNTAATDLTIGLYRGLPAPVGDEDPIIDRLAITLPAKTRWGVA